MKKLVTSIMATAMILGVNSCGDHDFEAPVSYQQQVQENFDRSFIKEFGHVYPDQDWGFGDGTETKATRAVETINYPATPAAPADNDFANEVPDGVNKYPNGYLASNGSYYVDETINYIDFQGAWNGSYTECGKLYVKGNVTPSEKFYIGTAWVVDHNEGATIYICKGATLNLTSAQASNLQASCKYYIAEGGAIRITDNSSTAKIVLNSTEMYNKGTIEAWNFELNGNGFLYNCAEGTVTIKGDISAKNANSRIVNDGTMTCGQFGTAGSSALWNIGEMTVDGKTVIDSNCATWVNHGHYTTGSLEYTAGSTNVYNMCYLKVNGTMSITLGDSATSTFNLGNGAAAVVSKLTLSGPARIKMDSQSMIKATDEIVMDCRKDEYGVHGIGANYAVLTSPSISKGKDGQGFEVSYSGKLYVATNSHFPQGNDGQADHPFIHWMDSDAQLVSGKDNAPISIPASTCSPGYGSTPIETVESSVKTTRVYAEDLYAEAMYGDSNSDWDFNDVVFDVVYDKNVGANGQTQVILQAAGGTLPLYLEVNGSTKEVHEAFQPGLPTSTMVNTGAGVDLPAAVCFTVDGELPAANVTIIVKHSDNTEMIIEALTGQPSAKFAVVLPTDPNEAKYYHWTAERVHIENRFSNFSSYASTGVPLVVNEKYKYGVY